MKSPKYPRPFRPPPPTRCRSLVLVDSSKIRAKAQRDLDKAKRDVEKARLQVEQFYARDEPAFKRWVHLKFGRLLAEIRELSARLDALRSVLDEIGFIAVRNRISLVAAYALYLEQERLKKKPPEPGDPEHSPPEDQADPEFDPDEEADTGPFSSFASLFEELEDALFTDEDDREENKRLKEIYRRLARLLHPDANASTTDQMRAWWNEAQQAYDDKDLARLEVLLSAVEQGRSTTTTIPTIASMQRLARDMQVTLRKLKRELSDCRKSPAWGAGSATPAGVKEKTVELDLIRERSHIQQELEEAEAAMANLKSLAEQTPPTKNASSTRRTGNRKSRKARTDASPEWDFG